MDEAMTTKTATSQDHELKRWKKVTLLSHTDWFVLGAGCFAVGCGLLALVDAALRGQETEIPLPFAGTPWPQVFPLVLFGVVTALAWTTSGKAVLRVSSIEVTSILARGVALGDIADMWELKPNVRWLRWRRRMWASSLVMLVCFTLYVSAALMYRLAFTIAPGVDHKQFVGQNNLLFGCRVVDQKFAPPESFIDAVTWFGYDAWERTLQTMGENEFVLSSDGLAAPANISENGWFVHSGWRGYGAEYLSPRLGLPLSGELTTSYLTFIQQRAPQKEINQGSGGDYSTAMDLSAHPSCGTQLRFCSRPSTVAASETSCVWIGLAAGTYRTNFTTAQQVDSSYSYAGPDRPQNLYSSTGDYHHTIRNGSSPYLAHSSQSGNNSSCPIPLSTSIHSQILKDLESSLFQGLSRTIPATLAARFALSVNSLSNTTALQALGLMPADKGIRCDVPSAAGSLYTGQLWRYYDKVFFPIYQYAAGALIIIWGVLLAVVAMPWRGAVLDGSLNMWMRLGADLGTEYHAGERRRLVIRRMGERRGQVGFEREDMDGEGDGHGREGVAVRTRLEYGWKYTYL